MNEFAGNRIAEIRSRIDEIDDGLVRLFEQRLSLVEMIAREKKKGNLPVGDPAREGEIVARLTAGRPETVAEPVRGLFAAIFDLSRAYQAKLLECRA